MNFVVDGQVCSCFDLRRLGPNTPGDLKTQSARIVGPLCQWKSTTGLWGHER